MKLLTKEIERAFPKLGDTGDKKPNETKIVAKFFAPWNSWTWFATEFDGEDTFYGMVHGFEKELGYFSLTELQAIRSPWGTGIERDLYYHGHTLDEVM